MTVICMECEQPVQEGHEAVAIVTTTVKSIPSKITYALSQPEECLGVFHRKCWDREFSEVND